MKLRRLQDSANTLYRARAFTPRIRACNAMTDPSHPFDGRTLPEALPDPAVDRVRFFPRVGPAMAAVASMWRCSQGGGQLEGELFTKLAGGPEFPLSPLLACAKKGKGRRGPTKTGAITGGAGVGAGTGVGAGVGAGVRAGV